MALINCPECGERVSDRAEICVHCGYPLKKAAAGEMNNDVLGEQLPETSEAETEGSVISGTEPDSNYSRRRNRLTVLAVAASFVLAIAIIVIVVLTYGGPKNYMQFGIKPGMNIGEIKQQLADNGFAFDYERGGFYNFKSGYIFGVRASWTYVAHGDDYAFVVTHHCGKDVETYNKLLEKLKKEYGEPHDQHTSSVYKKYAQWESEETDIELVYDDDNDVLLRYSCYVKDKIK